jgi:hypothetical protein
VKEQGYQWENEEIDDEEEELRDEELEKVIQFSISIF